jgi:hypothetical protein
MTKEERFKIRVENVENTLLRAQTKLLNDLEIADKIKLVAVKKIDLANNFTLACEKVAAEDEDKLPDTCSDLYNDLHTDEKSALDDPPEKKPAKKKKKLVKKGDGKKKTGPPQKPLDEYGTREGTLAFTFVQKVKEDPMTMAQARKAEWNPRGYHFDGTLRRLISEKKATLDKDTELITIT